ncbi:retrovirus-related pol polyprotein from transposon TNT 1-94 [Tanacetum coccineum]
MKCVTMNTETQKVLAPGMFAVNIEPIPPRIRNNKEAHLDYLKHLKESVKMLCEIVEEARIRQPLDNALVYACLYIKRSQELLEYVIGTCPKDLSKRDKKTATTPLTRKKQVTFKETCDTSTNNTQTHVKQQIMRKNDVPVIASTGVSSSTEASGSKPRSIKNTRILPTKSVNKKKLEDHPRNNSLCMPPVKNVLRKVKQVCKATGKLFANVSYQWKPTGKRFTLGAQCPLTRFTKSKVVPLQQPVHVSTSESVITKRLSNTTQKPLTRYKRRNKKDKAISTSTPIIAETQTINIVLSYLDSGCSKHITGNRSWLKNFMKKFIGTVRFENDHFGAIMGYGDYVIGDSVIPRVYYVEGLRHNLFSVGQFCDSDLKVAFKTHSCYVRDIDGVELLKGSCGSNLYTILVEDMMTSSPICLLSKASKNKSWLWQRRLNHLNFDTINDLARKDLVRGLPRLKFKKDHLCSACQLGKSKKYTHKPKTENTIMEVLHTLHMDLCRPMRVQSINGKKSKDETPEFVIKFLKKIQVGLNKIVRFIRTDNGIEFVNHILTGFYESVGITHQKSIPRSPQQNGVVERRNRTLVEAARTMLVFSKALMFLWAESVATACYTQNRSLIHTRHNKTPYELVHDRNLDLKFLRVFSTLCYPINDSKDLGKLNAKADIGIFVGYAPNKKGYRIYNKRTR